MTIKWSEIREKMNLRKDQEDLDVLSEPDYLSENRLVRKGLGLLYGRQSKTHGDSAVQNFKKIRQKMSGPTKVEDRNEDLEKIKESIVELSEGMIDLRKQLGSMTAMLTVLVLLNERTDDQIKKVFRNKR